VVDQVANISRVANYRGETVDSPGVRGTLGAVARTVLVVGGFVALFGGIVTLAYPPLLSGYVGSSGLEGTRGTGPAVTSLFGPTLFTSLKAIIWGMTTVAAGLAIPGRSSMRLLGEQPFTRRQRVMTLLGAVLVVGLPNGIDLAVRFGVGSIGLFAAAVLLTLVGVVMVVLGTSGGLKYQPRTRQNS
jgi:hypothetical protein